MQELVHAVKRYGRPQFVRTDNEAVLVSRLFRFGLWLLGIRQQRIQPGCPWQNGRVERFIGTVKRELARESVADGNELATALQEIRTWYNRERPQRSWRESMCSRHDQAKRERGAILSGSIRRLSGGVCRQSMNMR